MRTWLATLVLILGVSTSAFAYVPPAGIPHPGFCADDALPTTYTLYVNEATGSDANSGTNPAAPRATIPTVLAAGTRVSISGTYNHDHGIDSGSPLRATGTAANPVWIIGGTIGGKWGVTGSYLYIDSIINYSGIFVGAFGSNGIDTDHICVRDTEFNGSFGGVGLVIQANSDAPWPRTISNIVALRNAFHDMGDINSPIDEDVHCNVIYKPRTSNVWFVENSFVRCGGDGLQINATGGSTGGVPAGDLVHHIYVGRNVCSTNRQTCIWAKQSSDVVMSRNIAAGNGYMRPGAGGPGAGYGGQYRPKRLSIINNVGFDMENCVYLAAFDGGVASGALIGGNLCFDIHHTTGTSNPHDAYSSGTCIILISGGIPGGGLSSITVLNNTCWDVDHGINVGRAAEYTTVWNNIIGASVDSHLIENPANYNPNSGYQNYPTNPTVDINGIIFVVPTTSLSTSRLGDPHFVNAAGNDYRIYSDSPAYNHGNGLNIDASYFKAYGVNSGITTTHIGAMGVVGAPPPDPPTDPPVPPAPPSSGVSCGCGWRSVP